MIPVASTLLLGIPQTSQSAAPSSLPWPNGSLVSARVLSLDAPDLATIALGTFRMQARVPPNTPVGHIWLEVLSRELPAHMRILSESRVLDMLSRRVAEQLSRDAPHAAPRNTAASHTASETQPSPLSPGLPLLLKEGGEAGRRMLIDADDGSPRGMMQAETDSAGYALHGRVDLEHLQTVYFMLEKRSEQPLQLKLRATTSEAYREMLTGFDSFIDRQNGDGRQERLQGRMSLGPEPLQPHASQRGHMA